MPFLVRWPRHVPGNVVNGETVCLVDFMATVVSIIGADVSDNAAEDSYDILPGFAANNYKSPIREATVHHSINGTFAIRHGKWKLIVGRGSGGWSGTGEEGDPPLQPYDMEQDESERINLWKRQPKITSLLSIMLEKYKREGRNAPLHRR